MPLFARPEEVRITDPYFNNALTMDVRNMLKLSADRLLAGFRETAACIAGYDREKTADFMKNARRYGGGWENALIGGHTLGHYLSGMAQAVKNPALDDELKKRAKERLTELVAALSECQKLTVGTPYSGYIFGAELPDEDFKKSPDLQFRNVEEGRTNIGTQAWVPWYTMHKILAGLVDSYLFAGSITALRSANQLAEWISRRALTWSDEVNRRVLETEYGGMNEILYILYMINRELGDDEGVRAENFEMFKDAAHRFDETELFEAVASGRENALNGRHANTTIPKFLGALARYESTGEEKYLAYAESFWTMVVSRHSYITGGNSENEHFGADFILDGKRTNTNCETCNTYNMLKLSRRLFAISADKKYADYYERTLINAIMSSQDHKSGLTMYFQPMATGYQKIFGSLEGNFWCCTGTGYENFTKLNDSIFFTDGGRIYVNLYIASVYENGDINISLDGDLAASERLSIKSVNKTGRFSELLLRVPDWSGEPELLINGEKNDKKTENGYIILPLGEQGEGTECTVSFPMSLKAERLPDGENVYGFKYGPFVLSAELGRDRQAASSHGISVTVPTKRAVDSDSIGITGCATVEEYIENIDKYLIKEEGRLRFNLTGAGVSYCFSPHYLQDEESYGIYWSFIIDEDGHNAAMVKKSKAWGRLNRRATGQVEQCGRGQYEEQFLAPDGRKLGLIDFGSAGHDAPELSRNALAGGGFVYLLPVKEADCRLYLILKKSEEGRPLKVGIGASPDEADIVHKELISPLKADEVVTLDPSDAGEYFQRTISIKKELIVKHKRSITVVNGSEEGSIDVLPVCFIGNENGASASVCRSLVLAEEFSHENALLSYSFSGEEKKPGEVLVVPYSTEYVKLGFKMADEGGMVEADSVIIDEKAEKKFRLSGDETKIKIRIFAEDLHGTKDYEIVIRRDFTNAAQELGEKLVKDYELTSSAKGLTAVKRGTPPIPVDETLKTDDGGLVLDSDIGVRLDACAAALGRSYSISYIMKPEVLGGQFDPTLFAASFGPDRWLNLTFDGKLWSCNGAWVSAEATNAYTAGKEQTVTVVVDGKRDGGAPDTVTGSQYVDGRLVYTGAVADGIMTAENAAVYFGVNGWDGYFKGRLLRMMLFNDALTEGEVAALRHI